MVCDKNMENEGKEENGQDGVDWFENKVQGEVREDEEKKGKDR